VRDVFKVREYFFESHGDAGDVCCYTINLVRYSISGVFGNRKGEGTAKDAK
jgi:hypothetical protein